ncbi:MAG: hypothetical protein ACI3XF_04785, partial [Eubacteriales bacterium]
MKKALFTILLCISMLLCSCGKSNPMTNNSSDGTANTSNTSQSVTDSGDAFTGMSGSAETSSGT